MVNIALFRLEVAATGFTGDTPDTACMTAAAPVLTPLQSVLARGVKVDAGVGDENAAGAAARRSAVNALLSLQPPEPTGNTSASTATATAAATPPPPRFVSQVEPKLMSSVLPPPPVGTLSPLRVATFSIPLGDAWGGVNADANANANAGVGAHALASVSLLSVERTVGGGGGSPLRLKSLSQVQAAPWLFFAPSSGFSPPLSCPHQLLVSGQYL